MSRSVDLLSVCRCAAALASLGLPLLGCASAPEPVAPASTSAAYATLPTKAAIAVAASKAASAPVVARNEVPASAERQARTVEKVAHAVDAHGTNSDSVVAIPTVAPSTIEGGTNAWSLSSRVALIPSKLSEAVVQATGVIEEIRAPQLGEINPAAAPLSTRFVSESRQQAYEPPTVATPLREEIQPVAEPIDRGGMPIDMVTALAMTDAQNPQVALARARINEASWQLRRANILWLPSIRAGGNYNKHEGQIQDVVGTVFPTSRGALYGGLGANAVGAGSPTVPGLYMNFHTSDAVFQPKIAEQVVCARNFAAQAQANDSLLQTALAYIELLRAEQDLAIARETVDHSRALARLTRSFAETGQGLQSDDDRAQTELSLRESDLLRAEEAVTVAGARLAQQIRLDPSQPLVPGEEAIAPIELVPDDAPLGELVAQGLSNRPEIGESRYLVGEAVERLRREKYAPLMPSVILGVSYGEFGGGLGSDLINFDNRLDLDAIAFWEIRQLGFGEAAIRNESRTRIDQARYREVAQLDRVAREVVEAHAQVSSRRRQIEFAQRSIETAQSSYERNLQRIKNAQGIPIEALQAVQALASARREYLRAVADYNVAQFQLLRNLGGSSGQIIASAGQAEATQR